MFIIKIALPACLFFLRVLKGDIIFKNKYEISFSLKYFLKIIFTRRILQLFFCEYMWKRRTSI